MMLYHRKRLESAYFKLPVVNDVKLNHCQKLSSKVDVKYEYFNSFLYIMLVISCV